MLIVNGNCVYPALLVHCEMLGEAKLEVVRPDTVSAPLLFDRPVPRSELNDEPLITRFVVDAVTNDE